MSDKCETCDKLLNTKLDKIIEMVENLNLKHSVQKPVVVDLIKLYGLKPVSEYDDYNENNN
tara:strand:+ start:239 stop:421 length:183 start_codon:yes stop_codon:yes gene_type:complete